MQRRLTINVPWAVAAGMFVALAIVVLWLAFPGAGSGRVAASPPGAIQRVAMDAWNPGEISTDSADPLVFYDRTVKPPKEDYKTLLITFTATSDQHGEGRLAISCTAAGNPCDSYEGDDGSSVILGNHAGMDWHDNSVTQSWCAIKTGNTQIQLAIDNAYASGDTEEDPRVFFEHAVVTVDAVNIAGCTEGGAGGGFVFQQDQ
jgi:hypothetical protein